jgi:hypothetical protein
MDAQDQYTEICPASSHGAFEAISVKAEVLSGVEEEDPLTITFPEIKSEPEVSYVFVSMLGGLQKYRYPSFYELSLQ